MLRPQRQNLQTNVDDTMTIIFKDLAKLLSGLALVTLIFLPTVNAQSSPIPLSTVKQAINATTANWVAFRNFNGEQLLYLTQLLTWKCGLLEIRYAINSSDLANSWALPECNPQNPYHLDPESAQIYDRFPLQSIRFLSVQVVFSDGTATDVMTYTPCDVAGDASCAVLMK